MEVNEKLKDHEARLRALEGKVFPEPVADVPPAPPEEVQKEEEKEEETE